MNSSHLTQPAEETVPGEAYDMIDRFLRNNLDDADYATYSAALDVIQTDAYADGRRDEREELASVLPGVWYMDPPDGGAPTVLEQLQRQAKDARRYLWLKQRFRVMSLDMGGQHTWVPTGEVARAKGPTLDAAIDSDIDAAIREQA